MPPAVLRTDEAGALAAAWIHREAVAAGVRVLVIKGPTLSHYGLRAARVSADVDILVEPQKFDQLAALIGTLGWNERPSALISSLSTEHSLTFVKDGWPCDVDLHRYFPGFLTPPANVFELLWSTRERFSFANHICEVPSRTASILIMALHAEGGSSEDNRHASELNMLSRMELRAVEKRNLASLAVATGSAAPLINVLSLLGIPITPGGHRDSAGTTPLARAC